MEKPQIKRFVTIYIQTVILVYIAANATDSITVSLAHWKFTLYAKTAGFHILRPAHLACR